VIPPGAFVFLQQREHHALRVPSGWATPWIPFDARLSSHYSAAGGTRDRVRDRVKVKLRNLRVAPMTRLVQSEPLERPSGHHRAEFSIAGMVCPL
jgi:hypothetical protein